jgi:hypothetical protein
MFGRDQIIINGKPLADLSKKDLETLKNKGLEITESDFKLFITTVKETAAPKLNNELSFDIEKKKDGSLKAKAALDINNTFTTSIDQDGKIEAGVQIKF